MMLEEFKRKMSEKYETTDLGLMAYYLGIEVKQGEEEIFLSQKTYADAVLIEFKMYAVNSIATRVEYGTQLSKFDTLKGKPNFV